MTGNRLANAIAKGEDILEKDDFVHAKPKKMVEIEVDNLVADLRRSARLKEKAKAIKQKVVDYAAFFSDLF